MIGYKLLSLRKNGTLGPLFINKRQVIKVGEWMIAESHPTNGYAVRPGWHILAEQNAPHLSKKNRVWCKVRFHAAKEIIRPASQGGKWYLALYMKVMEVL